MQITIILFFFFFWKTAFSLPQGLRTNGWPWAPCCHVIWVAHCELSIVEPTKQYGWCVLQYFITKRKRCTWDQAWAGPKGINNVHEQVAQMSEVPTLTVSLLFSQSRHIWSHRELCDHPTGGKKKKNQACLLIALHDNMQMTTMLLPHCRVVLKDSDKGRPSQWQKLAREISCSFLPGRRDYVQWLMDSVYGMTGYSGIWNDYKTDEMSIWGWGIWTKLFERANSMTLICVPNECLPKSKLCREDA